MKALNYFAAAALMVAAFSFTSCNKEDETTPLAEVLQQDDEVGDYFDEILAEADDASLSYTGSALKSSIETQVEGTGTRTVATTFSGDTVIHTITFVNFANARRPDRIKNGIIVVKMVGRYAQEVFWRQVRLTSLTINDLPVQGTKIIEKTGTYQFTITLTGGRVDFADGTFYTRNASRVRTWNAGYNTPAVIIDDEYSITGTATGVNRNGNEYVHEITSPLIVKMNCRWIVQGIIEFVVNNQTAVLDYGDGTCDRIATLTVNGNVYTINLRGRL
jgi:hypothetical protein